MAQSDGERKRLTITMPMEMVEAIEDELEFGDSRAGWIREAVRDRMRDEGMLENDEQPAN